MRLSLLLLMGCILLPFNVSAESLYQCTNTAGHVTFSNQELKGQTCVTHETPALSVVPSQSTHNSLSSVVEDGYVTPAEEDHPLLMDHRQSLAINPLVGHNVAEQVCDLYGKWLDLQLKTRGGLYYDPQTAPLLSLFGGGYIPMECRQ